MLSKNYIHTKEIRKLLGRQYLSKGNRSIDELKAEIEKYLPEGNILKVNKNTGFLFIFVKE